MTARRLVVWPLAGLVVVGCASEATPTPIVHPTATAVPVATATVAPPPDVQRIDVLASGLGSYQLITVPVAVLRSAATRTGVRGLVVHFVPTRGGRPLAALDSSAVTLYPGETLAVTANCTDACQNADALTVTLVPGSWSLLPGSALAAGSATATCVTGCRGHGQWDVTATVGSAELPEGTRVDLFASCVDGTGRIIGGGQRQLPWPQSGGSLRLDVPAILSAPPASCMVGASARL